MALSLLFLTFLINVTSGYIRLFFPEGSRARIRCFYIPIALAILQRYIFNLDYHYLPIFLGIALLGLFIGGRIHRYRNGEKDGKEVREEKAADSGKDIKGHSPSNAV